LFPDENRSLDALQQQLQHKDYCAYADVLNIPNLPKIEREKVREHLIYLANALNKTDSSNNAVTLHRP
jgi:hypothetical protein